MSSRAGARMGLCLLVLLASTTLLPLAASDHAYSHRYVVYGRLVDSDGNPVPGKTVRLGLRDVEPEGDCGQQPNTETDAFGPTQTRPVTNQLGEFMFCTHIHSLSRAIPGTAVLAVDGIANFSKEMELDPYYRVSFIPLQLPEPRDDANKTAAAESYTVMGRIWREGNARTHVESIRVFGETANQVPVNVTLEVDGQTFTQNATTNGYGDFAVRFPLEARPTSGFVTVDAEGKSMREAIDPEVGTTAVKMEVPSSGGFFSSTTLYVVLGILAAAAVVGGAFVAFRRAAARREEENVRSNAQRRRANK